MMLWTEYGAVVQLVRRKNSFLYNMTILIINHHPQDIIGGSEIQCDLIASHLTRLGHHVVYLAVNGMQQEYNTPYLVEAGSLRWRRLREIIRTHRPDVVYWRFNKRKWLPSVLLCKFMRLKVVFALSHINDVRKWSHKVRYDATDMQGKIRQFFKSLRPALSSRINHLGFYLADGVVAQLVQQTGKLPIAKEIVITNSADPASIPFSWKKPFVLWAASIKQSKNPERFIELAQSFQKMSVDFLMVGQIAHHHYEQLIEQAGRLPNFHYLGVKTYHELNGIIQQARILVHTCEPEGFPNIFIQAWMQGTPTVSLSYDPDDMIRNHQLGYVSGNFAQFVQDTQTLIQQPQLCEEFGKNARDFATEYFLPEKNIQTLAIFLQEVCASSSGKQRISRSNEVP